jgi:glycosyltransferase involved in cell wall biosynthesis
MRLAVVTTSYPSFAGDPCGHFVETHAKELAKSHRVVVIAPEHGVHTGDREESSDGSLTVLRLVADGAFGWPGALSRVRMRPLRLFGAIRWAILARRALATLPALDRIVAHWAFPCGWPIAHDRRVPLELVSHGQDVRALARLPPLVRRRIVGALLGRAQMWTFVSTPLHDQLARTLDGQDARRLETIARIQPSPIEIPNVADTVRALRAEHSDARLIVCVGRLVPSKRVDRVLDHVAKEYATGAHSRLVIVGDGPLRPRLERQARTAGLDVLFVGQTRRDVALAWIGAAEVVLHASCAEGASTVKREAQELGVPFFSIA